MLIPLPLTESITKPGCPSPIPREVLSQGMIWRRQTTLQGCYRNSLLAKQELREAHRVQPTPRVSAAGRSGILLVFFFLSSTHVGDVRTTSRKPCLPSAPLFLTLNISCSPISLKPLFKPGKGREPDTERRGWIPPSPSQPGQLTFKGQGGVFCVDVNWGRTGRCLGQCGGLGAVAGLCCASRAGLGSRARTRTLLIHFSCLIFRPA